ncbi:hypothetical protein [Vineibacter terrae]|uniref:hypothetical protein n=1 Tax=Vineibacter terrae TaxID=2586908 RepID=UPI002E327DD1|nr:hypothetical protein [Vineibacter terrae]HEX2884848.1 hypothetical protein [Vineibacter terrae]
MIDRGGPLRRLHVPMRASAAGLVMTRRGVMVGLSAAAGSLVVSGSAAADPVKSGTVEIEQVQIAFLASGNLGGGTLHFGGKSYAFQIGGLGIGGIGISKMQAYGEVYNLSNVSQFPGAYGQARIGYALGDKSAGELSLQNEHNVIMKLKARRQGLALSLGADAVYVNFK